MAAASRWTTKRRRSHSCPPPQRRMLRTDGEGVCKCGVGGSRSDVQVNETAVRALSTDRDLRATVSELSLYRTAAQQLKASHDALAQQV